MFNKSRKTAAASAGLICFMLLASGCGGIYSNSSSQIQCHIVIEDTEGITVTEPAATVNYGESAIFTASLLDGYSLDAVDYENTQIEENGNEITITLKDVKYSETVSLEVTEYPITFTCYSNLPAEAAVSDTAAGAEDSTEVRRKNSHLKINTPSASEVSFQPEGYTLAGWNTMPDGSGISVGLGSRIDMNGEEEISLYAQWEKWTENSCFTWTAAGNNIVITGYDSTGNSNPEVISVPGEIEGKPVISIAADAIADSSCNTLILPESILTIKDYAISLPGLKELYLFDGISTLSDRSFEGCELLSKLHINAVEDPVYSNNYFGTFADKYDWLCSIEDQKKIVLFSGSSARFGYDSEMLKEAFGDYEVANMGVFAYTNGYPQALLILNHMQEGDILLDSPEFDAAKRQFFTTNELDDSFFCMMEANYDMILDLDLTECSKVFSSLYTYLTDKSGMDAAGYDLSPSDYDEDGNRVNEKSYNQYGDYILYRENAETDDPIYGLEVPYTVSAYPYDSYVAPANAMFQRFLDMGVKVYFTYSPRNSQALSEESTEEARAELDAYLRENLIIPVISDIEESLYPGTYLYGTDNHLSTEGVQIRTECVINDLKNQWEWEAESVSATEAE